MSLIELLRALLVEDEPEPRIIPQDDEFHPISRACQIYCDKLDKEHTVLHLQKCFEMEKPING